MKAFHWHEEMKSRSMVTGGLESAPSKLTGISNTPSPLNHKGVFMFNSF